ncbi:SDR family NAD(P)-dependent oxidoreductase [Bradyrhizobium sp.]|jgi:NAD(P)-dependent dehydrogenase (short-subunit alcohol dehydrogenase family)|uniref:SDR family NAD(P)-dependent oxidoreductase n=1 Tax=Bradyrhizobium sp. TaxID=376 RepID=UPI003D0E5008
MSMRDKTVLITGSTDGVGRRVASRLAALGANVLVHGRNRQRAEQLIAEIRAAGGTARFYHADLSSLSDVRALAAAVRQDCGRLDILINNAGIGVGGGRQTSAEGYELRFAVNYLAGFLLTRLLLPMMVASRPARIVNVTSIGQQPLDFDNVMLSRAYSGARAYCQSKLAQIMLTFDLAQELETSGVTANCVHPATYMDTTMVRNDGISPISTVEEGADAILQLAAAPQMEGKTGLYFEGLHPSSPNRQAYNFDARARLRRLSCELAGWADLTPEKPAVS